MPLRRPRAVIATASVLTVTDPDHPYMYHCHLLRHEDSGMMGQFLVVKPGTTVPTTNEGESHHEH